MKSYPHFCYFCPLIDSNKIVASLFFKYGLPKLYGMNRSMKTDIVRFQQKNYIIFPSDDNFHYANSLMISQQLHHCQARELSALEIVHYRYEVVISWANLILRCTGPTGGTWTWTCPWPARRGRTGRSTLPLTTPKGTTTGGGSNKMLQ